MIARLRPRISYHRGVGQPLIECVPNFSEGRDAAVVRQIAGVIESVAGVRLLAQESDADHNRSVLTFAGQPESVLEAAFRSVAAAARCIDLNRHRGAHPRIGAADVVPLVPLRSITLEECAALAHRLGERIWRELSIPVYFYEAAALRPERRRLEQVRKGQFEGLRQAVRTDPARLPDLGPDPETGGLHPTAGAVAVGARKILIACNINLQSDNVEAARRIARAVRESSGGLAHVKAIGLLLESRNQAQVSMNLTDFEATPVHTVFEAVRAEASRLGVEIAGTEIIGLWPRKVLEAAAAYFLRFENYRRGELLEDLLFEERLKDSDK